MVFSFNLKRITNSLGSLISLNIWRAGFFALSVYQVIAVVEKNADSYDFMEVPVGAYQELARGFGVREYKLFFAKTKPNQTRFKTAREFDNKVLGGEGFGSSLVRNALFAVREAIRTEEAQTGKNWLRNEFNGYWDQRKNLIKVLNYLGAMEYRSEHWKDDSQAARLVSGAVENDHA